MWETRVQSLGWEDLLEKEMATHTSILAWKIPWTEEPGRLQSIGLQRVGRDWGTSLSLSPVLERKVKVKLAQLCPTLCDPMDYIIHGLYNSPGKNTGVGSLSLLQGIFPTQGLIPGLPHYKRIICQLNHKGSQRILKWVAYPFFSRPSQPRNWTGDLCLPTNYWKLYSWNLCLLTDYCVF